LNLVPEQFEKHLSISNNAITAIDVLAEHTSFSRQQIKKIMQKGAVWLSSTAQTGQGTSTQRLRRASKPLKAGQVLHLYYNAKILEQADFNAQLIADEGDYSVWFKPSGMPSQGSKYGDHTAIYRWAETHIQPQRNAFLVHRLDKATSGLILIAHSKKAARLLSKMFSERRIHKYYKALVQGVPQNLERIDTPLENKIAITKILSITPCQNNSYSLLDIQLLTGRKHQIRQHLAKENHPIIGDRLYGQANKQSINLCLSAYKIHFISPFDSQKKHYELNKTFYPSLTPEQAMNSTES